MRILIVSDTHGRHDKFDKALEKAGKIDLMIHLGDITKIDGISVEPVWCVTGGSPCQDLSIAGKRNRRISDGRNKIKIWLSVIGG